MTPAQNISRSKPFLEQFSIKKTEAKEHPLLKEPTNLKTFVGGSNYRPPDLQLGAPVSLPSAAARQSHQAALGIDLHHPDAQYERYKCLLAGQFYN